MRAEFFIAISLFFFSFQIQIVRALCKILSYVPLPYVAVNFYISLTSLHFAFFSCFLRIHTKRLNKVVRFSQHLLGVAWIAE